MMPNVRGGGWCLKLIIDWCSQKVLVAVSCFLLLLGIILIALKIEVWAGVVFCFIAVLISLFAYYFAGDTQEWTPPPRPVV